MKRRSHILLAISLLFAVHQGEAQIQDDESSKSLLAMQCAMSSGLPPSNYEEYCRKLAKTVGLLNPSQQERVFGYLPRPAVVSSGDISHYGQSSNASNGSSPNTASKVNPLVALVGDFNDAMAGRETDSGGIIGGEPPASETPDNSSVADPTLGEQASWWGGLLDWVDGLIDKAKKDRNAQTTKQPKNGQAVGWTSGANGKLDVAN